VNILEFNVFWKILEKPLKFHGWNLLFFYLKKNQFVKKERNNEKKSCVDISFLLIFEKCNTYKKIWTLTSKIEK